MGQSQSKKETIDITEKCVAPGVKFHEEKKKINGSMRNVSSWLPVEGDIKAVVFISHGLLEHALAYYELAHRLVAQGYGVYGIDHCGHGLSDGRRAIIPDYRILYSDFVEFVNGIRPNYPGIPAFLFCHSMGGVVGLMSIRGIKDINAAVFSAAALVAGPASASPFGCRCCFPLSRTSFAACLTSVTAAIDPAGPAAPLDPRDVSADPEWLKTMSQDPRRNKPFVPNKTAQQLLRMIKAAKEEVPRITIPFLCFHGSADEVIYKESSEFIFKNAGTDITQRRLHIFEGAKHECFHDVEPYHEESLSMIIDYFNEQYEAVTPVKGRELVVSDAAELN